MKRILLLTLLATCAYAEEVFFSAAGKTFHKANTCAVLARSKKVFRADKQAAEQHGLHACRSCYAAKKGSNTDWAREVK